MGAAWREPKDVISIRSVAMVEGVKALGMETCVTLGMLTGGQAQRLKDAGLDLLQSQSRYLAGILRPDHHHPNLPGAGSDTLDHVRSAGIHVCCGGIVGMGEAREDRVGMIAALADPSGAS